jgi:catechol 2,3-dioxygenase-like lactoylglutathione lyase family enzyme
MSDVTAVPEDAAAASGIPARISLVTLGCTDLPTLTAFYRALGWPQVTPADEGVSFFRLAGSILSLFPAAELAADATLPVEVLPEGVHSSRSLAINLASPQEVDAALAVAQAAGGRVVKPGQKVFWGGYSGYFADPEGNLWEVAHNPYWPLDERGLPIIPEREPEPDDEDAAEGTA